jgi:hypothetical protein
VERLVELGAFGLGLVEDGEVGVGGFQEEEKLVVARSLSARPRQFFLVGPNLLRCRVSQFLPFGNFVVRQLRIVN